MKKPVIVISAANSTGNGGLGCLSVVQDCLRYLSQNVADRLEIVALVHDRKLFDIPNVTYLEFPYSSRSILFRLYHEHIAYRRLSKRLRPELWLSLVNLSPSVEAKRIAVYCHNTCNLYRMSLREAILQPRFAFYNLMLGRAYAINITKNDYVIVQQAWIREEFERLFGVKNVVVATPNIVKFEAETTENKPTVGREKFRFFYPAFPQVYKNFEVVIAAASLLRAVRDDFEICFTFDSSVNRYAQHIARKCKAVPEIRLLGIQKREAVFDLYRETDCLIFPSKLESWGLPITEFKHTGRPMLVADLPYAHETVGSYESAAFFEPRDAVRLAKLMVEAMKGELSVRRPHPATSVAQPFAQNWAELFAILLGGTDGDAARTPPADGARATERSEHLVCS